MKKILLVFLLSSIALSQKSLADDRDDVAALAKKAIDNIIVLLQDTSLTRDTCKSKVQAELLTVFDLSLTAKLTLGRKHWTTLNTTQRKEFQDLFIKQLVNTYFDKAKLFADKTVNYENPKMVKNKIHVAINCTSKGEKIRINNKFYKSPKGWLVYDLEIQGISIVRSYGSQYAQILKDGSVDGLLTEMRKIESQEAVRKD